MTLISVKSKYGSCSGSCTGLMNLNNNIYIFILTILIFIKFLVININLVINYITNTYNLALLALFKLYTLKTFIYTVSNILNLTLLNILKIITAVNNILYTGSDYYIIIIKIPVSFSEKLLYVKLNFFKKTYLRFF